VDPIELTLGDVANGLGQLTKAPSGWDDQRLAGKRNLSGEDSGEGGAALMPRAIQQPMPFRRDHQHEQPTMRLMPHFLFGKPRGFEIRPCRERQL
jgi:hypothetical protein